LDIINLFETQLIGNSLFSLINFHLVNIVKQWNAGSTVDKHFPSPKSVS